MVAYHSEEREGETKQKKFIKGKKEILWLGTIKARYKLTAPVE